MRKKYVLEHMVKVTRKNAGLEENPTIALVDSQCVQNASVSEQSGYDAGKKIWNQATNCYRQNRLFTRRCGS